MTMALSKAVRTSANRLAVGSPAAPRVKIHPSLPPEERYFDVPAPVGYELRGIKVILVRTLLVE